VVSLARVVVGKADRREAYLRVGEQLAENCLPGHARASDEGAAAVARWGDARDAEHPDQEARSGGRRGDEGAPAIAR
jgi:hypothetical protein